MKHQDSTPTWLAHRAEADAAGTAGEVHRNGPKGELAALLASGAGILEGLLAADGVTIWFLNNGGSALRCWAANPDAWVGMEVDLALYPRLADWLRIDRPRWVERAHLAWPARPAPLQTAYSFVFLPLCWLERVHGCALLMFEQPRSAPAEPELRASQALAGLLAGVWWSELGRDAASGHELVDKFIQPEKLALLGQLLSGVAHELNNPLTTVAGYAQLLQRHRLPPTAREELGRLAQEAERALRIVRNLLVFARPGKPERHRVSVHEVLEQVVELRAYELAVESINIERRYAPHLPAVWAHPYQLQQVFLNLLLNAEQAIRSQGGRGKIVLETFHLSDPERVRVEIRDTGPGIPPPDLARVFDPFFTTKEPTEGTGLGLAVSRLIVREHGGEIAVGSSPEGGASFAVELPAWESAEIPAETAPRLVSVASLPRLTPTILVVDDEPYVAQLIADVLHQQGYTVERHTDSRQALRDALARDFDLVICDIKMPELDGETFHRLLAERGRPLAARILFTTGDTLARKTNQFLERVGLPCLPKPFLVDELTAAVRDLLDEDSARGPAGLP